MFFTIFKVVLVGFNFGKMPFIVRETQNIDTPQTFYNPDEDTIDFINDPDIIRDALPQPYRFDKISFKWI